jgi:hypothetical protein
MGHSQYVYYIRYFTHHLMYPPVNLTTRTLLLHMSQLTSPPLPARARPRATLRRSRRKTLTMNRPRPRRRKRIRIPGRGRQLSSATSTIRNPTSASPSESLLSGRRVSRWCSSGIILGRMPRVEGVEPFLPHFPIMGLLQWHRFPFGDFLFLDGFLPHVCRWTLMWRRGSEVDE